MSPEPRLACSTCSLDLLAWSWRRTDPATWSRCLRRRGWLQQLLRLRLACRLPPVRPARGPGKQAEEAQSLSAPHLDVDSNITTITDDDDDDYSRRSSSHRSNHSQQSNIVMADAQYDYLFKVVLIGDSGE